MAKEDRIFQGIVSESLTTAHLKQGNGTESRALTTAHIQQKIDTAPAQNQSSTGNTSSGSNSGQQGSNSSNQK